MANAPGVIVNVSAAPSSTTPPTATGQWFVLGVAAGPAGVVVPVRSVGDFANYFGQIVNTALTGRYTLNANVSSVSLYDALDVYFREGGAVAYVSRVNAAASVVAATSAVAGNFILTASGGGTWANSSSANASGLILTITGSTVASTTVQTVSLAYNGVVLATATGLITDTDVINWINSLTPAFCTAAAQVHTTILPASGSTVSVYFTGGTDVAVADSDVAAALLPFNILYGPGQVSYPGNTDAAVYVSLATHAQNFNRVAVLDGANTATAATLTAAVATLQSTAGLDPSYASFFAPWLVVPGVVNVNPSLPSATVFNRTVAPCALAAAAMALNDASNDSNNAAAGVSNGNSIYSTNVSQVYSVSDRGLLNAAGVNVIRIIPNRNVIAIYGFRSAAFDANWVYLNNVRFRMQMVRDFDVIGEGFVFQEIDGQGKLISAFNGALAGKCQQYWVRGSLYGQTSAQAFVVNTGSALNTAATIAANHLVASVSVKMSPFAEQVTINVTKYLASSVLAA